MLPGPVSPARSWSSSLCSPEAAALVSDVRLIQLAPCGKEACDAFTYSSACISSSRDTVRSKAKTCRQCNHYYYQNSSKE